MSVVSLSAIPVGLDKEFFQKKLEISDSRIFNRIWECAQRTFRESFDEPTSASIETALRNVLVYSGKGIEPKGIGPDLEMHQIVHYLLGNKTVSAKWIKREYAGGILFKENQVLHLAMEEELRAVLAAEAGRLSTLSKEEETLFEAFIHNVVAFLPYCYPKEGAEFVIPQKVEGQWRSCKYKVDREIPLTPKWFATPITAYGLVAEDGPPLLSFLGTTFPAGRGFVSTLLSDFTPGLSVGHAPYLLGKKEIEQWLEDKQNVRLFGMSLGGALSFHVLKNHRDKVASADVFNPAGLYPWDWKEGFDDTQKVNIYYQENDLVATMGSFPTGENVSVYRVYADRPENFLKAHVRAYTGGKEVTLVKSDPHYENRRALRKILTGIHFTFSFALAFLPIIIGYVAYSILIKPFVHLYSILK